MAGMLERACACLKNGIERQVVNYEAVCEDLNVNKKDMIFIPISWSQVFFFVFFLTFLLTHWPSTNFFFFSDPSQFLKWSILQEEKMG